MNLDTASIGELTAERDRLARELSALRSTRKNLGVTIKHITDDVHEYYKVKHELVPNAMEPPRF